MEKAILKSYLEVVVRETGERIRVGIWMYDGEDENEIQNHRYIIDYNGKRYNFPLYLEDGSNYVKNTKHEVFSNWTFKYEIIEVYRSDDDCYSNN